MRILITGGAGCLGSNLVEKYLGEGHPVLVVDNFATSRRDVLPPGVPGLEVVEGSVTDAGLVERLFAGFAPTHVVHGAASYHDPDDWATDVASNVGGTVNVVAATRRHGVRKLVHLQTALVYGRPDEVPIPVGHPLRPFTSYGITKAAAEGFVELGGVPWVSLRLANVASPRLAIGPIPTFYKRLRAGQPCFCSETVRDFLDVRDFFSLMDLVMEDGAPSGVYNVSTGQGHAIKEVFDVVVDHLGVELDEPVPLVPPGDDDVPAVVLDPAETTARLGWKAEVGFEDTVRSMLEWYDRHGVGAVYSHLRSSSS